MLFVITIAARKRSFRFFGFGLIKPIETILVFAESNSMDEVSSVAMTVSIFGRHHFPVEEYTDHTRRVLEITQDMIVKQMGQVTIQAP